jgi:hypothetical protein
MSEKEMQDGSGVFTKFAKLLGKKGFKFISNRMRKKARKKGIKTRLLMDGELHCGLHNFTGPGTKMDLARFRNMAPIDSTDAISKVHDMTYWKIQNDKSLDDEAKKKGRREADEVMIKSLNALPASEHTSCWKMAKFFIGKKISGEKLSPALAKRILGENLVGGGSRSSKISIKKGIKGAGKRIQKGGVINIPNEEEFRDELGDSIVNDIIDLGEFEGTTKQFLQAKFGRDPDIADIDYLTNLFTIGARIFDANPSIGRKVIKLRSIIEDLEQIVRQRTERKSQRGGRIPFTIMPIKKEVQLQKGGLFVNNLMEIRGTRLRTPYS